MVHYVYPWIKGVLHPTWPLKYVSVVEEGYYARSNRYMVYWHPLVRIVDWSNALGITFIRERRFASFLENDGNLNEVPLVKDRIYSLEPTPKNFTYSNKRVTLKALKLHPWVLRRASFSGDDGLCNDPELLAKKLFSHLKVSLSNENYLKFTQDTNSNNRYISTQPIGNELAELNTTKCVSRPFRIHNVHLPRMIQIPNYNSGTVMTQEAKWTQFISYDIAALQFHSDENDCNELVKRHLQFNPNKLTKFYTLQPMDVLLPI